MEIKCAQTGPIAVNTYLCYDETKKGFIVDPGGYSDFLKKTIQNKQLDIEYIILTHGHGDHIAGIEEFKELCPKALIVGSQDELVMFSDGLNNGSVDIFGRPITVKCDKLVADGTKLKVGNMDLTFITTPGHTPGGMCVLVGDVLFSGDTLFQRSVGRTDLFGGNFTKLAESIKNKLFSLPEEVTVLPGHMGPTTIGDEKRSNPFV